MMRGRNCAAACLPRRRWAALTALPNLTLAEAERKSAVGSSLVQRIAKIDIDELPPDIALSVRLVSFRASTWAREAEWYWTVSDPLGVGFFGMFLPTAYCGGFLLSFAGVPVRSRASPPSFSATSTAWRRASQTIFRWRRQQPIRSRRCRRLCKDR